MMTLKVTWPSSTSQHVILVPCQPSHYYDYFDDDEDDGDNDDGHACFACDDDDIESNTILQQLVLAPCHWNVNWLTTMTIFMMIDAGDDAADNMTPHGMSSCH